MQREKNWDRPYLGPSRLRWALFRHFFFSNLERFFTFPALSSTKLTFEQNFSIFSLFGKHISTFLQFSILLNSIFYFVQYVTKQVANQEIAEDEVMVSFDVVSLFTAIPVDKTCDYTRKKLDKDTWLHLRTKLNTNEVISLLEFTLSNNNFMFNESVYKQIHGCAMGSPVSPVVANLCMEVIEIPDIAASTTPLIYYLLLFIIYYLI